MSILGRIFHHSPKHYGIAAGIGVLTALLVLLRDGFHLRIHYMNALTVAGAVVLLIGLLLLVGYYGAFDTFGYSFSTLGRRRYDSLYEYSQAKQQERSRGGWLFCPYLITGLVLLLIGLLLGIGL